MAFNAHSFEEKITQIICITLQNEKFLPLRFKLSVKLGFPRNSSRIIEGLQLSRTNIEE